MSRKQAVAGRCQLAWTHSSEAGLMALRSRCRVWWDAFMFIGAEVRLGLGFNAAEAKPDLGTDEHERIPPDPAPRPQGHQSRLL